MSTKTDIVTGSVNLNTKIDNLPSGEQFNTIQDVMKETSDIKPKILS